MADGREAARHLRGPSRRRRLPALVLAGLIVLAGTVTGCSRSSFTDHTARLTRNGTVTVFTLDSCGRDRTTLFVVGRTDTGMILQEVVGLRADKTTAVTSLTGVSVTDRDGAEQAAFGSGAWRRRGRVAPAPGQIYSARLRGSRIQVSGAFDAVPADGNAPSTSSANAGATTTTAGDVPARPVPFSLDARCDR